MPKFLNPIVNILFFLVSFFKKKLKEMLEVLLCATDEDLDGFWNLEEFTGKLMKVIYESTFHSSLPSVTL